MTISKIEIAKIRLDGGTQMREALDQNAVDDYAAGMIAGDKFPPVRVFFDDSVYWLTDGFHRVAAAKQIAYLLIEADVQTGTQRDAIIDSTAANAKNGLRRSQEATRRSIITLLKDKEWGIKSDSQIAKKVGCDHKTVGARRAELEASGEIPKMETRMVERGGVQYQMKAAAPSTYEAEMKALAQASPHNSITHYAVEFQLGDVAFFRPREKQGLDYWKNRCAGRIARITDTEITFDYVTGDNNAKEENRTIGVGETILPLMDIEYVHWYRNSHYTEETILLFSYKDHFIAFRAPDAYTDYGSDAVWWAGKTGKTEDKGVAYRFHPDYLKYWRREKVPVMTAPEWLLPYRMRHLVARAGRARSGKIKMPPQPETVQPVVSAPERPALKEWAYVGNTVQHMSGKHCLIENTYFTDRWMIRAEIVNPKGDGFCDAPEFEFGPLPEPTQTPIQVGDTVLTRTGRMGEVTEANGLITVKTASYTSNHTPASLKPVPIRASKQKRAPLPPLMTEEEMERLEESMRTVFIFIQTRLETEEPDLLTHLDEIRRALNTVEAEHFRSIEADKVKL